jgi:regulator of RNase E activity RraA
VTVPESSSILGTGEAAGRTSLPLKGIVQAQNRSGIVIEQKRYRKPFFRFTVLTFLALSLQAFSAPGQQPEKVHSKVKLFIPYEEYTLEENEKTLALFEGLRVADVSDGMDVVGLADVGLMDPEIRTLWRDTENFEHRIIGIAVTARYVPTNLREPKMTSDSISRWYRELTSEAFVDVLFPGSILVIDGHEDNDTRTIGSSNIQKWRRKGALGVITSGGVGDTDEIIAQRIPVYHKRFGRGLRPGRNQLESVNRPVTCGGVLVRPGDVIIADGEGVIVVPRERAEDVAAASKPFLDNIGLERYQRDKQSTP